jgi:hypothetical protein
MDILRDRLLRDRVNAVHNHQMVAQLSDKNNKNKTSSSRIGTIDYDNDNSNFIGITQPQNYRRTPRPLGPRSPLEEELTKSLLLLIASQVDTPIFDYKKLLYLSLLRPDFYNT